MFSLGKCPEVELLDMIVLFLIFWRNSMMFPIVAAPIDIPTNSAWGSPFLHILCQHLWFAVFLMRAILSGVRWYLLAVLIYIPWLLVMFSIFSCICWPSVCFPWKNVYSGRLLTFNQVVLFFGRNSLYILGINTFLDM